MEMVVVMMVVMMMVVMVVVIMWYERSITFLFNLKIFEGLNESIKYLENKCSIAFHTAT